MKIQPARLLALFLVSASIGLALPAHSATPAPKATPERNDYADVRFTTPLSAGLKHFYARDFKTALTDFESALKVVPDNTLAISFLNAAAAQQQGELDVITNLEEDASSGAPKNYVNRVRLGFSYMFAPRDRSIDAREELNAAVALNPDGTAAHVGLGILRFNERSANRAIPTTCWLASTWRRSTRAICAIRSAAFRMRSTSPISCPGTPISSSIWVR
jgi:tetratricopeptide (TPR) repeat protein